MAGTLRWFRAKRTPISSPPKLMPPRSLTKDGGASNRLLSEPPTPQRQHRPDGLGQAQHPSAVEKSVNRADRRGTGKCEYEPTTALLKRVEHHLAKRLLLAASFILWAIDQLLRSGRLAMFIGDAVVSAYVLDLFWII